jgi:hypothetical protein
MNLFSPQPEPGKYTIEDCYGVARSIGMPDEFVQEYYDAREAVGWLAWNQLAIVNLKSDMGGWWRRRQAREEASTKKKTLYPLTPRKVCGVCKRVPAVHVEKLGDYEHYYCRRHIPAKSLLALREEGYDV